MKKNLFSGQISWLFRTAIVFLFFMTIARVIFFFHFKPAADSVTDPFAVFLLGLRYDIRIVCGMILFPFLISLLRLRRNNRHQVAISGYLTLLATVAVMVVLLIFMKKGHAGMPLLILIGAIFGGILGWLFYTGNCNPFENRISKNIFRGYFLLCSILLPFLYVIDFQHFDYLHQRLNASVMNYAEDAKISANMVWQTYPVVTMVLIMIAGSVFLYAATWLFYKKVSNRVKLTGMHARIIPSVLFALLLGFGIFGKLNQYPLRWSDAFSFKDDFKANVALNPVQSFLSTLQFRHSSFDEKKVHEFYPLMADYLGIQQRDSAALSFSRQVLFPDNPNKPNVVIVLCESFSSFKSGVGGNPLQTTPYFDKLAAGGIFFDRCFTPAYGTARGVWATITGIPDVEYPNTASRNPSYVNQHSILNDYTGYEKFYFIGGSLSWANIRGVLTNNITDLKLYEDKDFQSEQSDVWGISDKRLFLESNEVLKKQTAPFVAVIQTADNHRPYTIPEEDRETFAIKTLPADSLRRNGFQSNEEYNAFRYMDFSIETFMEAARKEAYFQNTIFVFVGDHGIRGEAGTLFPEAWDVQGLTSYHVPLLFYAPALLTPQRLSTTCSQVDLLPSVTALAGMSYTNTTLGINLFDTTVRNLPFKNHAFLFDPGIKSIGMVTDQFSYMHNLLSGKEDYYNAATDSGVPANGPTNEQRQQLKILTDAYYETARYLLSHNKK